jgi:hypothetical protein
MFSSHTAAASRLSADILQGRLDVSLERLVDPQRQRGSVIARGAFGLRQKAVSVAAVQVVVDLVGDEPDGCVVVGDGLRVLALFCVGAAAIVEGANIVGLDEDRLVEVPDGEILVAAFTQLGVEVPLRLVEQGEASDVERKGAVNGIAAKRDGPVQILDSAIVEALAEQR